MPTFTADWTSHLNKHLPLLYPTSPPGVMTCVEIGSYEGRGAIMIHDYLCKHSNSKLFCIDPFFPKYYNTFRENVSSYPKIIEMKGYSDDRVPELEDNSIDFVYIDGGHTPGQAYRSAVDMFIKMKHNGTILFDDYLWVKDGIGPKEGIDRFMAEYSGKLEVVIKNYQVAVRVIKG
jgi:predicted O-methyltransferase YrrM